MAGWHLKQTDVRRQLSGKWQQRNGVDGKQAGGVEENVSYHAPFQLSTFVLGVCSHLCSPSVWMLHFSACVFRHLFKKKKSTICPDWSALTGLSGQDSLCFHISSATGVLGTLLRVGNVLLWHHTARVCVRACVCVCARVCVRACVRACVRTCVCWLMMYITWHWRSFSLCHLNTSTNCCRGKWPVAGSVTLMRWIVCYHLAV